MSSFLSEPVKEPRYTLSLGNLSINDVCSLHAALDPERPRNQLDAMCFPQAHAWRVLEREFRRIWRDHEQWRRAAYPRLYRQQR